MCPTFYKVACCRATFKAQLHLCWWLLEIYCRVWAEVILTIGWLVAWHSGVTSVFGRRAFPVLCSTCSWWVATYVGKPSATGQPTRPTRQFILSRSINEYDVIGYLLSHSMWFRMVNACGQKAWCGWLVMCLLAAAACPMSVNVGSG